jgi:predicted RNA-binding Zn-ribbon protein involved in translation (DUF1610 family)
MTDAGWLCVTKETEAHGRLGEGYGDVLGERYVWKADLPNARRIAVGDAIVLWNNEKLLGVSWIHDIEEFTETRSTFHCPNCQRADVRIRKTVSPKYRCGDCGTVFEIPIVKQTEAQYLSASYGAGWTPSVQAIGRAACKDLSRRPASQLSLQDIDMTKFRVLVDRLGVAAAATRRRDPNLQHGHRLCTVRTRVGQGAFRDRVLNRYGPVCALTGPAPQMVLDAAHLYRYSEVGVHHQDGGLLFRRDIHRLFDLGLIAVEPVRSTIDIHSDITIYPTYGELHGRAIRVSVSHKTSEWLGLHWDQFRGSAQPTATK